MALTIGIVLFGSTAVASVVAHGIAMDAGLREVRLRYVKVRACDTGCWCVRYRHALAEITPVEPDPVNTGEGMSAAPAHSQ